MTARTKVTSPKRTAAGTRSPATNRLSVRNFGTALVIPNGNTTARIDTGFHPDITLPFSMSCWVKPSQYKSGSNNESSLWAVDAATTNGVFVLMNSNTAGTAQVVNIHYYGATYIIGTIVLNTNKWYHVVTTWDGTNMRTYINGVKDIDDHGGTPVTNASNLLLMARTATASAYRPFAGTTDEYILFNKALSQAEINSLYYQGTLPSGVVGRWLFDETSGTLALDSSGNGNNGTIMGATYTTNVPMVARSAT